MKVKIGVIQITSGVEPDVNLTKIRGLLASARDEGAQIVFLPEVFYSLRHLSQPPSFIVEPGNVHYRAIQSLAIEFGLAIMGGSATTRVNDQFYNRAYQFAPDGSDLGHYDKQHLFSCDFIDQGKRKKINESDLYTAGKDSKTVQYNGLTIGISLCFDLRFSPMFWQFKQDSCQLISVSSAFTVPTGQAHWHTLLKARAIETQSFVVAAAQWGKHSDVLETYGHSLIVDPWGTVLADAGNGERIIFAEIDTEHCHQVKQKILIPSI